MTEWNEFVKVTNEKICLSRAKLQGTNLRNADLSGANLREVRLQNADLSGANLEKSLLNNGILNRANLCQARFYKASLYWTYLEYAILEQADFRNAFLFTTQLTKANLSGANLREAYVVIASFYKSNLVKADLRGADLSGTNFNNANLNNADLRHVKLCGAKPKGVYINRKKGQPYGWANFHGATLSGAKLSNIEFNGKDQNGVESHLIGFIESGISQADLSQSDLSGINFNGIDLSGINLRDSNLRNTNFTDSNLNTAILIEANLSSANITGTKLYGTSRDDWIINGIKCDYVYWDVNGIERTPKDRNFELGEFEKLYKSLPEITYYFSDDFTPFTPMVMDSVVNEINQKHPQFEIRLDSFHSRGTPHAVFTVLHKEHTDDALAEITNGYEKTIQRLEGRIDTFKEIVSEFIDRPQSIRIDHMGNTFNTTSGHDTNIATDKATINVSQDVINQIHKTITESDTSPDDRADAKQQLDKMTQELAKPEPDKGRIKRCYDYVVGVIPKVAEVVPWGKLIEKTLGL